MRPILVTGAAGRQGRTGLSVARTLRECGRSVRALVRVEDERVEVLRTLGVEVVRGDYMDYASLLHALTGVESAYFCHPVAAGIAEAAGMFAAAGRQAGLRRIVDLSLGSTSEYADSPQVKAQWVAERIFEWAGFEGVHLRIAAFFMENMLLLDAPGCRQRRRIANAFGNHPLSWISGVDVGRIAAAFLCEPMSSEQGTWTFGGVERRSYPEIAETISGCTGTPVRYEELSPEEWREELLMASTAAGRPNARGADHLSAQAKRIRRDSAVLPVSENVADITGTRPLSIADFIREHKDSFRADG